MGKGKTVKDILGEPDQIIIGPDYAEFILKYDLGYGPKIKMLDYYVWVYNTINPAQKTNKKSKSLSEIANEINEKPVISGTELLVVFNRR
jgi:hypothetical protein